MTISGEGVVRPPLHCTEIWRFGQTGQVYTGDRLVKCVVVQCSAAFIAVMVIVSV